MNNLTIEPKIIIFGPPLPLTSSVSVFDLSQRRYDVGGKLIGLSP